jgi:SM-20-related protein
MMLNEFGAASVPVGDEDTFALIADAIEARGYVVLPAALPEHIADDLVSYLAELDDRAFHAAAVGRGTDQIRNDFVRRDQISWIDDRAALARSWQDWIARLRSYLNQRLYLGLFSFESHFAVYQPGDFYRKHYDAFRGESNRVLSLVTYLNKGWEPDQGGELVIYSPEDDGELVRVTPNFGTLVLFLSEEFPHAVMAAQRERYSVAGWFRINTSLNAQIDPPR